MRRRRVSAGLDLALALAVIRRGEELAKSLRLTIEYDPPLSTPVTRE